MTSLTIVAVLQAAMMGTGSEGETYARAYREASANGVPMVVFVSTEWCPPCQQMKKHVLPEVRKRGILDRVVFAVVNPDQDRNLAQALIGGGPIPQLLMYRNTPSGWTRRQLIGGQSIGSVEQFIQQGLVAETAAVKKEKEGE